MENVKKRLLLLDGIRGFAIVNMVLFPSLGTAMAANDLLDISFSVRMYLEYGKAETEERYHTESVGFCSYSSNASVPAGTGNMVWDSESDWLCLPFADSF